MYNNKNNNRAFTIVELLVVIVVIGILAAISIVAYSGISKKANTALIESDLSNNMRVLQLYHSLYDSYPTSFDANDCPLMPVADVKYCLIKSNGSDLSYTSDGQSFDITIDNLSGGISYQIDESGTISEVAAGGSSTFVTAWGGTGIDYGYNVTQSVDGGYAVTGYEYSYGAGGSDIFVTKYNSDGTLAWNKTWGGTGTDSGYAIDQTSDGGFIVTGNTNSYGAGNYDCVLLKFTSDGVLSWNKVFGGSGTENPHSVIQTSDGGYAVAGDSSTYGTGIDAFISKFDSAGALSWTRTWGGANTDYFFSVVQTNDGGYAAAGHTSSYGAGSSDVLLVKYTSTGTVSWAKVAGGASLEYCYSLVQTSDNGYAVTGQTMSYGAGSSDVFTIKYDSSGNISWTKAWGGSSAESANYLTQTGDGGYVVAGNTMSFGAGSMDSAIFKLNSDGSLAWSRTFGSAAGNESASGIYILSDGGLLSTGFVTGYGAGNYDSYLAKYDSSGNISGCSSPMCQSPSATLTPITMTVNSPSGTVSSPAPTVNTPSVTLGTPSATNTVVVNPM